MNVHCRLNLAVDAATANLVFLSDPSHQYDSIGEDGLPIPGRLYNENDPYCSVFDLDNGNYRIYKYKASEAAFCGLVRIVYESAYVGKRVSIIFNCFFALRLG